MEQISPLWPFVWGIYRWPVDSPHKETATWSLMFCLMLDCLNKQSSCQWFTTPWCPLWRHCSVISFHGYVFIYPFSSELHPWAWWRHQMETFSALLAICAGNSLVTGEFPAQRPVTRSFDFFYDLCLNGWVNNREAGDLRRYRAHYDVTVVDYYFGTLSCG